MMRDWTYSFSGEYYTLTDSPALPKPARPIPVIVGGKGPRRTPALAARFADEFNVAFAPIGETTAQFERVAQACADTGRDPAQLVRSCAHTLVIGAPRWHPSSRSGKRTSVVIHSLNSEEKSHKVDCRRHDQPPTWA